MRNFTNLAWPEIPFGSEQRPFGKSEKMLAAFAWEWDPHMEKLKIPLAVATVYLRLPRHGALDITDETLSFGFRVTVTEVDGDVPRLLETTDRALGRARRLAAILAGHNLEATLHEMLAIAKAPLRGIDGLVEEWPQHFNKTNDYAQVIDTNAENSQLSDDLLISVDMPSQEGSPNTVPCASLAHNLLCKCLTIGLTAARLDGRYGWNRCFRVTTAVDRMAWDVLGRSVGTQDLQTLEKITA